MRKAIVFSGMSIKRSMSRLLLFYVVLASLAGVALLTVAAHSGQAQSSGQCFPANTCSEGPAMSQQGEGRKCGCFRSSARRPSGLVSHSARRKHSGSSTLSKLDDAYLEWPLSPADKAYGVH